MKKHKAFMVSKSDNSLAFVLLVEHKDGGYSFVNITKMHICPCIFDTMDEAIKDLDNFIEKGKIISYTDVTDSVDFNAVTYKFLK